MRIACPSCDATYEVPESRLTPGKMARCARCGNKWLPVQQAEDAVAPRQPVGPGAPAMTTPSDPAAGATTEAASASTTAASAIAPPVPTVTAMDRLAAAAPQHRRRPGLVGAWAVSIVVLAGAIAATLTWRDAVVRAWPPSGRILATNGATTAPAGQTAGKKPQ